MARLIDADDLIDALRTENQICITSTGHELTMDIVYGLIEHTSTAYNVDKVVEELVEAENRLLKNASGFGCTIGIINAMKNTIEIVRKGGV